VDRMNVDAALAALGHIEAVMAAFVETAPRAVAAMGGADGLIARSRMTALGPIPRFTVEEWSAIALEGTTVNDPLLGACQRFTTESEQNGSNVCTGFQFGHPLYLNQRL
jgi:hypothetical protein